MKPESHLEAFEERKDTLFKWALEVRGLEKSQRIVGDNASKAIVELLSAYLHKKRKVEEGFQINHAWFKSERVSDRFPEFEGKALVMRKLMELEKLCENLSYGAPKPLEKARHALDLFRELEILIKGMMA